MGPWMADGVGERLRSVLGYSGAATLPLVGEDATAGSETELQTAVIGPKDRVDLPRTLMASRYYKGLQRRAESGEAPARVLERLEAILDSGPDSAWENSWVRIPMARLSPAAQGVLEADLCSHKGKPGSPPRSDRESFFVREEGATWLRVPVSYLLKLALAQAMDGPLRGDAHLARPLLAHFSNDNTSPETTSFAPQPCHGEGGLALARETCLRQLLCEVLVEWAGESMGLTESGQRVMVYSSPLPPQRQRALNAMVPDAFYRELFINPCLSGWDQGEEKKRYMHLCHEVLSRSQLNALGKLREAGLLDRNLVVLPSTSSTCLANNGIHVSLGSRKLSAAMASGALLPGEEKWAADLVVKVVEHFLPLFVGVYSAAPYRLGFEDFHPETALGFLPHELDFTHLRMLWRRWKKKAKLKVLGQPITPFGPLALDRLFARVLRLRGDHVPDFRLIDYMTCLMSTDQSPCLSGQLGSDEILKAELAEHGVFHPAMSTYLLYKPRLYPRMGFSGFEGRFYSLFPSYVQDMARAVDLQRLVTAVAWKFVLEGRVDHQAIPDAPTWESERRQAFFAAALDIPTVFVRPDGGNRLLLEILSRTSDVRPSRRYPGYLRVRVPQLRMALVDFLQAEAPDVVDALEAEPLMADLRHRLIHPEARASSRLTALTLSRLGAASPLDVDAGEFNRASEGCYRQELRVANLVEGLDLLEARCRQLGLGLTDGRAVDWLVEQSRAALHRTGRLDPDACRQLLPVLVAVARALPCAKERRHAA
jgi:hypothetical protein